MATPSYSTSIAVFQRKPVIRPAFLHAVRLAAKRLRDDGMETAFAVSPDPEPELDGGAAASPELEVAL